MSKVTPFRRPDPPDPSPAAPAAGTASLDEKRLTIVSFRCPESLNLYLDRRAEELGVTKSHLLAIMVARDAEGQRKRCGRAGSIFIDANELREELEMALADGRVDATERARITKPATRILNWLWNRGSKDGALAA